MSHQENVSNDSYYFVDATLSCLREVIITLILSGY